MVYSLRTGKGDEDIDATMNSIPSEARSKYLKDAVRFYAGLGGEIKQLNKQIEKLLSGNFSEQIPVHPAKQEPLKEVGIDILESSIEDLLNL